MDTELPFQSPSRMMGRFLFPLFLLFGLSLFPSQVRESGFIPTPIVLKHSHSSTMVKPCVKTVPKHSDHMHSGPKETRYQPIILAASTKHQVDPALVKAIIKAESGYNPVAVSNKGAVGLMQLMPATADDLGVENRFDPKNNIDGGVKYLKQLLNRFEGDLELAIAAYNAGIGNVRKYAGVPPYKATRYYVKKVLEYYRGYKGSIIRKETRA